MADFHANTADNACWIILWSVAIRDSRCRRTGIGQGVYTCPAIQIIAASRADNHIIACPAINLIIAAITDQHIPIGRADKVFNADKHIVLCIGARGKILLRIRY